MSISLHKGHADTKKISGMIHILILAVLTRIYQQRRKERMSRFLTTATVVLSSIYSLRRGEFPVGFHQNNKRKIMKETQTPNCRLIIWRARERECVCVLACLF